MGCEDEIGDEDSSKYFNVFCPTVQVVCIEKGKISRYINPNILKCPEMSTNLQFSKYVHKFSKFPRCLLIWLLLLFSLYEDKESYNENN